MYGFLMKPRLLELRLTEFKTFRDAKLPLGEMTTLITAVIETGNHIAQLADGQLRRQLADKLSDLLKLVVTNQAPWCYTPSNGGRTFSDRFSRAREPGQHSPTMS